MQFQQLFVIGLTAMAFVTSSGAVTLRADTTGALPPAIIPQPLHVAVAPGFFTLDRRTAVVHAENDKEFQAAVTAFVHTLRSSTGYVLPLCDVAGAPGTDIIRFIRIPMDSLGAEDYRVTVRTHAILIEAASGRGALYGAHSLLQLFPPAVFSPGKATGVRWTAPCVDVADAPRYAWRGMMLDVVRHFMPKEFVKRFIDYLVMHKMNTFHWHLTDDQGWRIQILAYPKLTDIGAWRVDREDRHWNARPPQLPGEKATYGGFYTQDDIRDVVRYAADHFITIVPEIEMPAHVSAVLSAYPEYSCTGGPFTLPPGGLWPITDILCAGNDSTFVFVENVLREVTALFPGTYIHIGGDEADKTEWKRCPKCQARIRTEGLKDEAQLQSYFTTRVERILSGMHRRLLGWDEIIEGGLPPEATVMSWRGVAGGIHAARSGHDVVMSPTSHCYFDYYQADPRWEPIAIGGYVPLEKVYAYEPTPDSLTPAESMHILGTQANLWTEFIPDPAKLEYMAFPRIAAIAEVGWSSRDRRAYPDFLVRLDRQMARYEAAGINASRSIHAVTIEESIAVASHQALVTLATQAGATNIRYTLDRSTPGPTSPLYTAPFPLTHSTTIRAAAFDGRRRLAPVTLRRVAVPMHEIASMTCVSPLDSFSAQRGSTMLFDNRRGHPNHGDTEWVGVTGTDLVLLVDLGAVARVKQVTVGFLHETAALIFLPPRVDVAVSRDGQSFTDAGTVRGASLQREKRPFVKDYVVPLRKGTGRYLRITAQSPGPVPEWHKRAGSPSHLVTDEVIIE